MTDTTVNYDDFEKIQTLIKAAFYVPSTNENTQWYDESSGKFETITEAKDINVANIASVPTWNDISLTSSELTEYDLSDSDFADSDENFASLHADNGTTDSSGNTIYNKSTSISPGAYKDVTGNLILFVRLQLEKADSLNASDLVYTKYDDDKNQILSNSFQVNFNELTGEDTDGNNSTIQPFKYFLQYRESDGNYISMDISSGNWAFDFKSGIITFADDPEDSISEIQISDHPENLYFTFVKYVGPRGLDKHMPLHPCSSRIVRQRQCSATSKKTVPN